LRLSPCFGTQNGETEVFFQKNLQISLNYLPPHLNIYIGGKKNLRLALPKSVSEEGMDRKEKEAGSGGTAGAGSGSIQPGM